MCEKHPTRCHWTSEGAARFRCKQGGPARLATEALVEVSRKPERSVSDSSSSGEDSESEGEESEPGEEESESGDSSGEESDDSSDFKNLYDEVFDTAADASAKGLFVQGSIAEEKRGGKRGRRAAPVRRDAHHEVSSTKTPAATVVPQTPTLHPSPRKSPAKAVSTERDTIPVDLADMVRRGFVLHGAPSGAPSLDQYRPDEYRPTPPPTIAGFGRRPALVPKTVPLVLSCLEQKLRLFYWQQFPHTHMTTTYHPPNNACDRIWRSERGDDAQTRALRSFLPALRRLQERLVSGDIPAYMLTLQFTDWLRRLPIFRSLLSLEGTGEKLEEVLQTLKSVPLYELQRTQEDRIPPGLSEKEAERRETVEKAIVWARRIGRAVGLLRGRKDPRVNSARKVLLATLWALYRFVENDETAAKTVHDVLKDASASVVAAEGIVPHYPVSLNRQETSAVVSWMVEHGFGHETLSRDLHENFGFIDPSVEKIQRHALEERLSNLKRRETELKTSVTPADPKTLWDVTLQRAAKQRELRAHDFFRTLPKSPVVVPAAPERRVRSAGPSTIRMMSPAQHKLLTEERRAKAALRRIENEHAARPGLAEEPEDAERVEERERRERARAKQEAQRARAATQRARQKEQQAMGKHWGELLETHQPKEHEERVLDADSSDAASQWSLGDAKLEDVFGHESDEERPEKEVKIPEEEWIPEEELFGPEHVEVAPAEIDSDSDDKFVRVLPVHRNPSAGQRPLSLPAREPPRGSPFMPF